METVTLILLDSVQFFPNIIGGVMLTLFGMWCVVTSASGAPQHDPWLSIVQLLSGIVFLSGVLISIYGVGGILYTILTNVTV